jgi:hypothetical protein
MPAPRRLEREPVPDKGDDSRTANSQAASDTAVCIDQYRRRRPARVVRFGDLAFQLQAHVPKAVFGGGRTLTVTVAAADHCNRQLIGMAPLPLGDLGHQRVARPARRIGEHQHYRPAVAEQSLETACLAEHLSALSARSDARVAERVAAAMEEPVIDYVRLNIVARRAER